jgi:hypothetical protein
MIHIHDDLCQLDRVVTNGMFAVHERLADQPDPFDAAAVVHHRLPGEPVPQ